MKFLNRDVKVKTLPRTGSLNSTENQSIYMFRLSNLWTSQQSIFVLNSGPTINSFLVLFYHGNLSILKFAANYNLLQI